MQDQLSILAMVESKEFVSAVIGAFVGGFFAIIAQALALWWQARDRKIEKKEAQQQLGYALLFKLIRIQANMQAIAEHFWDAFEAGKAADGDVQPWQVVMPLANVPDPIHFRPEELALLLALKEAELFNQVGQMDVLHNTLIVAAKLYGDERVGLTSQLVADRQEGHALSGTFTEEERLKLAPRMLNANSLWQGVYAQAKRDSAEARIGLTGLLQVLCAKLDLQHNLSFPVSS